MVRIKLDNILKVIDLYYPKGLSYEKPEYKSSPEFLNRLRRRYEAKQDVQYAERLMASLRKIFNGYCVINWTDLESYNCYEYRILLHKNKPVLDDDVELMKVLGGKRIDLFLFISILDKYYYFFTNETIVDFKTGEWKFKNVFDYSKEIEIEIESLMTFMSSEGYNEISNDIAHEVVSGIDTELIEKGMVKIFNCLFTDLISI